MNDVRFCFLIAGNNDMAYLQVITALLRIRTEEQEAAAYEE